MPAVWLLSTDYHYAKERDSEVNKYFDQNVMRAWADWNRKVFESGLLGKKTKELIAIACTYMTRCPWCIEGHAKIAMETGVTKEEIAEVIQIAMALSSGAPIAYRNIALDV